MNDSPCLDIMFCVFCLRVELCPCWRWVLRPGSTSMMWPPFQRSSTFGGHRLVQAWRALGLFALWREGWGEERSAREGEGEELIGVESVGGEGEKQCCDRLFWGWVCCWKAETERAYCPVWGPLALCGPRALQPSSLYNSLSLLLCLWPVNPSLAAICVSLPPLYMPKAGDRVEIKRGTSRC